MTRFQKAGLLVAAILCPLQVLAALGGREATVADDMQSIKVTKRTIQTGSQYTTHTIDAGGTTIREYVTLSGDVFAVTWRGLAQPDLSVLLGNSYGQYTQARIEVKATNNQRMGGKAARQPLEIVTADLVVRHSGHMRDLRGRAYLSSSVPAGVNAEELP